MRRTEAPAAEARPAPPAARQRKPAPAEAQDSDSRFMARRLACHRCSSCARSCSRRIGALRHAAAIKRGGIDDAAVGKSFSSSGMSVLVGAQAMACRYSRRHRPGHRAWPRSGFRHRNSRPAAGDIAAARRRQHGVEQGRRPGTKPPPPQPATRMALLAACWPPARAASHPCARSGLRRAPRSPTASPTSRVTARICVEILRRRHFHDLRRRFWPARPRMAGRVKVSVRIRSGCAASTSSALL